MRDYGHTTARPALHYARDPDVHRMSRRDTTERQSSLQYRRDALGWHVLTVADGYRQLRGTTTRCPEVLLTRVTLTTLYQYEPSGPVAVGD